MKEPLYFTDSYILTYIHTVYFLYWEFNISIFIHIQKKKREKKISEKSPNILNFLYSTFECDKITYKIVDDECGIGVVLTIQKISIFGLLNYDIDHSVNVYTSIKRSKIQT